VGEDWKKERLKQDQRKKNRKTKGRQLREGYLIPEHTSAKPWARRTHRGAVISQMPFQKGAFPGQWARRMGRARTMGGGGIPLDALNFSKREGDTAERCTGLKGGKTGGIWKSRNAKKAP